MNKVSGVLLLFLSSLLFLFSCQSEKMKKGIEEIGTTYGATGIGFKKGYSARTEDRASGNYVEIEMTNPSTLSNLYPGLIANGSLISLYQSLGEEASEYDYFKCVVNYPENGETRSLTTSLDSIAIFSYLNHYKYIDQVVLLIKSKKSETLYKAFFSEHVHNIYPQEKIDSAMVKINSYNGNMISYRIMGIARVEIKKEGAPEKLLLASVDCKYDRGSIFYHIYFDPNAEDINSIYGIKWSYSEN